MTTDILWLDTETRSRCDLKKRGTYNYCMDPSTEVLIACYAFNHGPIMQWRRWKGEKIPADLARWMADEDVQIRAHSPFERLLLRIDLGRYYDTAAQMRALAIPGGLDAAARFLKGVRKDPRGQELIRLLSVPRKDGTFLNDPFLLEEFTDYCTQDVNVMRKLSLGVRELDERALALYRANEAINDRGIPVDLELARLAVGYAEQARAEAATLVTQLTGGLVTAAGGTKLTDWVYERVPPEARTLMRVIKRRSVSGRGGRGNRSLYAGPGSSDLIAQGEEYPTLSLDRGVREALIDMAGANPEAYPEGVIDVVEANDAASPASVAKFQKLIDLAASDGRLHGAIVMDGAGQTGRFSAWGAQVHNLPRVCAEDPDAVLALMRSRQSLAPFGSTLAVLKSMLRAAIFAGHDMRIVRTDWSAVEARGLPWLADCPEAERYLDAFRDPKRDVYVEQAVKCGLGANRQAGKVLVLALGYGGSVGALGRIAAGQGVIFTMAHATIVAAWRAVNPWAVMFWSALDRAARQALIAKGSQRKAGRLVFEYVTEPNFEALTMLLPSGRRLFYPFARFEEDERGTVITFAKSAWRPKADKKGEEMNPWPRAKLWGGLLAENATQAVCADLLRHVIAMGGEQVIAHLHDEVVSEARATRAKTCARDQEKRMLSLPDWAEGFPLAVESDISVRFRK